MAACYRKRPVDNKSYVVDSKGGQSFGEGKHIDTPQVARLQHDSLNQNLLEADVLGFQLVFPFVELRDSVVARRGLR